MHMRAMLPLGFLVTAITMLTACGGTSTPTADMTAAEQPTSATIAGGTGGTAASGSAVGMTTATVHIVAKDFTFALDTSSVPSGQIVFILTNAGPSPHNFTIKGSGVDRSTPLIDAGETATMSINLPLGGYTYTCSVAGHEQLGMKGIFTSV